MYKLLFLKQDKRHIRIHYEDIQYIEATDKYIKIVTPRKSYTGLSSLRNIEKHLPPHLFCRIHRAYIVAYEYITEFTQEIVEIGGVQIPIGRQYRNKLLDNINIINSNEPNDVRIKYSKDDLDQFMKLLRPN